MATLAATAYAVVGLTKLATLPGHSVRPRHLRPGRTQLPEEFAL